jgi:hypothetical protein
MNNCILFFHQGWTDIINCLGLINYYSNRYNHIDLIIRSDSLELINYYTKSILNINIIYIDKHILDSTSLITKYFEINNTDYLCHGIHDHLRIDNYQNRFNNYNYINIDFVKKFYTCYDIDYMERINSFNINRDYILEELIYNQFIEKYTNKYILYHNIIENYDPSITIVNLNQISNTYFDMIKVLVNAIEIHLLDSSWGAICYLLDAKYKLFQNKKIYLYANRGYSKMFIEPIKLDNWILI